MDTLQHFLQNLADHAITKAFGNLETQPAEVVACTQEEFGHYQCNNALRIAKQVSDNPRNVAKKIIDHFTKHDQDGNYFIEKMEIAGPGFINITLNKAFLSEQLTHIFHSPHLGVKVIDSHPKTIVEFSSPNIAKELHVGHLRSTIIGDCLARLFEFLNHNVLRLNHVGDWGTQFGMLISFIKQFHPEVFKDPKAADLTTLNKWYKESKALFDSDVEFKKQSQLQVVSLQQGEKEAIAAWKIICDISRRAFQEIYDLLDVKILERGESFYNPYLQMVIDELQAKGLIMESDGAKCIFIEGFKNREGNPLPIMVQKSDGGFNYDTTDMAGFRHRCTEEKAQRIIIVTDSGQSLHFKMIHAAAVMAGYIDPKKTQFDHVPFGLVLGPDGKKFKTRSGETEKLADLLHEAVKRAKAIVLERLPDISEKELDDLSYALGIGAVKYADLSSHRTKDYSFSYDRMLKFEGNTAAFLLYAYVRIMGIKRKSKANINQIVKQTSIQLEHPSEISLGLHLRRFGEILEVMAKDLLPNRLCDYLYALAEKFNIFFRDCRVVGSELEHERLFLCELTAKILKKGLNILGLNTVNKM